MMALLTWLLLGIVGGIAVLLVADWLDHRADLAAQRREFARRMKFQEDLGRMARGEIPFPPVPTTAKICGSVLDLDGDRNYSWEDAPESSK